jgi:benzoylformate decarboxylase
MSVDYVMAGISDALPEDVVVVDEASSSKSALHRHVRPSQPGGYYSSAAGGLGFAMPAAVGLKLALPDRPVVCVIGDGATMYSLQALWSAAQYGVAVPFVVINNTGYSILKSYRDSLGIGGVPGLDLPGLDILRTAEGLGCKGERVEIPEDLHTALERALNVGEPYVLDVLVDTSVPPLIG